MFGIDLTQLYSSNLELIGVLTGIINVLLLTFAFAPRWQWWNWPAAVVNAAIYLWLFYEWGLYGNMILQVPFLVVNVAGLWTWRGQLRNNVVSNVEEIPTTWATHRHFLLTVVFSLLALIPVYPILAYVNDPEPFWDGLILTLSLGAAWLQYKKHVQSWIIWIAVDCIAVPFHYSQGYPATSFLYFVYGVICFYGLYQWWQATKTNEAL